MTGVRFDEQMTEVEGLLWRLGKDPHLSANVGNLTVLDRPPDVDRLRRRLERATRAIPRLRQRVKPAPVNASPPTWVDDPDFDVRVHIRHICLPPPGSLRQLLDLATLLAADPFDRTRPLWGFVVIDGLVDGGGAVLQRFHHTMADGEASLRLMLEFLDLEADAPEPDPLPPVEEPSEPEPAPGTAEALRDIVVGGLRMPLGWLRQFTELLAEPSRIPGATAAAASTVHAVMSQLSDTDRARSPLWVGRSLRRQLEILRAPLEPVRSAAKALGGTLNVAFVTAAAEAAGTYHRQLGVPVDQLRASMAVSTRTADSGSNAYTLARLLVPTAEMPIADRFALVKEATATARATSATASLDTFASAAATLPTSLVTRIARQQAQTVDFATSNVRAAPFPVYLAGARVVANYPIGPLGGVAFNLTLLSYDGSLDMGLHIDAGAVEEPPRLRAAMEQAFEELAGAAS